MKSGSLLSGVAGCAAILVAVFWWRDREPDAQHGNTIPLATPPGVTLQYRADARGGDVARLVYADATGMTLYYHKGDDRSENRPCADVHCNHAWLPALAPPGVVRSGSWSSQWSLFQRADGTKQWVYQGLALHTFGDDRAIGDTKGDGAEGGLWHAAEFRPGGDLTLPVGFTVREIADAAGAGLVDSQGMTLYVFDGEATDAKPACEGAGSCAGQWLPIEAPAIAGSTGEFSVHQRDDGIAQWAFHRKPLYRFDADQRSGDATGMGLDARMRVALVTRYFMPEDATIGRTEELGEIRSVLATATGASLYHHDRVIPGEGKGFRADHSPPAVGRLLGTTTCDDVCVKSWPPFLAPPAALPSGYWGTAARAGGGRQWTYKGFALYTYAHGKSGDVSGNETYRLAQIGEDPLVPVDAGEGIDAMVWHVVLP